VIQHSMITKSIERAQRKVEENNFGIRKRLLEYDDVMNSQREVIYKKRRHALYGERLAVDISNMIYDVVENIIATHQEDRDYEAYRMAMLTTLAADAYVTEAEFTQKNKDELTDEVYEKVYKNYRAKCDHLAQRAYPVIKEVYENQSRYENIAIPITDGKNAMQVVANLKKAYNDKGREVTLAIEKGVTLGVIDDAWKDHLREMDELRSSVQNATYEQKDPLLIYKFESFELFKILLQKVNRDITAFITKANLPVQEPSQIKEAQTPRKTDTSKLREERSDLLSRANPTSERQVTAPIRVEKKVGRNDPCPCGSGKKYKNCHGREE